MQSGKVIELSADQQEYLAKLQKDLQDTTSEVYQQQQLEAERYWTELRKDRALTEENRRKETDYMDVLKRYGEASINSEIIRKIQAIDVGIKTLIAQDPDYFNKNNLDDKPAYELYFNRTSHSSTLNVCNPLRFFSYAFANFTWNINDNVLDNKVIRTQRILDEGSKVIFTKNDLDDFRIGQWKSFRKEHTVASRVEEDTYSVRSPLVYVEGRFLCPQSIPEMMEWYCTWMTERFEDCQKGLMSPIIFAGVAGFIFVSIHPYSDANGRTRELIEDFILQAFRYPIKHKVERLRSDVFYRESEDQGGNSFRSTATYKQELLNTVMNSFCNSMHEAVQLFLTSYEEKQTPEVSQLV